MAKRRRTHTRAAAPPRAIGRSRSTDVSPTSGNAGRRSLVLVGAALLGLTVVIGGIVAALGGTPSVSPSPSPSPAGASSQPSGSIAPTPSTPAQASFGAPTVDPQGRYPTIDGVSCDSLEHTDFHIHAHLVIRVSGESQVVPEGIGIHDTCLYWLHTHRASGIIHVEAPADAQVTLGTFFDIWGQPLSATQVAGWPAGPEASVFVFVNGEGYTGDPRMIRLKDLENIELQVGPAPLEPLPYEFSPDFR